MRIIFMECTFCKMIKDQEGLYKIWENEEFLAFLSIFPNTEGFCIVTSKKHYSADIFDISDEILYKLITASKKVAHILSSKLQDVGRVSLVLENIGVDHIHAKLIPLHGTANIAKWKPITAYLDKYFEEYEGYISTHDYVREDNKTLEKLAKKLQS